jgi:hypothetical protein
MNHASLVKGSESVHYLGHYVCFEVIQILGSTEFSVNVLNLILFLCRYKIFVDMSNLAIIKESTLRDSLSAFFTASRQ